MNREVSLWMKNANNRWGQPAQIPFFAIKGYDSVVWSRLYSHERYENPEEKIQVTHFLLWQPVLYSMPNCSNFLFLIFFALNFELLNFLLAPLCITIWSLGNSSL
jgi:hypothetical protein